MITYTGCGWLVLPIYFSMVIVGSKIAPQYLGDHFFNSSQLRFIVCFAAINSSPICLALGLLVNRKKVEVLERRWGRERIVLRGRHNFSLIPIEFWAWMIPLATLFGFFINVANKYL